MDVDYLFMNMNIGQGYYCADPASFLSLSVVNAFISILMSQCPLEKAKLDIHEK